MVYRDEQKSAAIELQRFNCSDLTARHIAANHYKIMVGFAETIQCLLVIRNKSIARFTDADFCRSPQ